MQSGKSEGAKGGVLLAKTPTQDKTIFALLLYSTKILLLDSRLLRVIIHMCMPVFMRENVNSTTCICCRKYILMGYATLLFENLI